MKKLPYPTEPKSSAPLPQGAHLPLKFQVAHQRVGMALIRARRFSGEFGHRRVAARRTLPGGLTNQGDGLGLELNQGRDPVEIGTGKERLGIVPETGIRVL